MSIFPHEAKALLELFCLQPIVADLAKGKIAPAVLLPHDTRTEQRLLRQNKDTRFYIGGSGLDRTDNFKNFADQDWIGFNFIRSGLDSD